MPDIIALGDINVDLIARYARFPVQGRDALADAVEFYCGGSAANTARALARLGFRAGLIGRVGADPWAQIALRSLGESGVLLTGLQRDPKATTGLIYIVVTPDGERTMLSYRGANANTDPDLIPEEEMVRASHLHLSGYALLAEPQRTAALRAIEMAGHHALTISLDPGLAPAARNDLRWLLPRIDILLPTLAEAQALTGQETPTRCVQALLERGVRTVAVKLGRLGCLVGHKDGLYHVPSFPIEVSDSTGAGDSFNAGIIAGFLRRLDWHSTAVLANTLGALAASRMGAGTEALTPAAALVFLDRQRETGTVVTSAPSADGAHSRAVERAVDFLRTLSPT